MLNIAYNLLAGGACLEHLEFLRSDEAYLDALGARRIPDPTTAGDFCRRFEMHDIIGLMEVFNATRLKVWRQQRPLRSGKPAATTQKRRAVAFRSGGQPVEQLGVHGNGLVGLELESLVDVDVAGSRPPEGDASRGKTQAVADGLRHLPSFVNERAGANPSHRAEDRLSAAGVESVATSLLSSAGSDRPAAALLIVVP